MTRLGAGGAHEIKSHKWFSSLNWDDILAKKVAPPFKPYVSSELDVGNFAEEFTNQDPVDSPGLPITKHNEVFRVRNFGESFFIVTLFSYLRVTHLLGLPFSLLKTVSSLLFLLLSLRTLPSSISTPSQKLDLVQVVSQLVTFALRRNLVVSLL